VVNAGAGRPGAAAHAKSSHNRDVLDYLLTLALALGAAAVVIVVAAAVTTERFGSGRGARGLRQDTRRAWDVVRRRRPLTTPAATDELERAVSAEPVETSLEDFFAANVTPGTGYLDAEALADRVGRAASAARAVATRTTHAG